MITQPIKTIIDQQDFYEGRLIGAEIKSNLIGECEFVRFATGTTVQKMQDDLNDPNSKLWNRLAEEFDDAGWDAEGYEVLLSFSGGGCFVPLRDVEEEANQLYFNHRYFARYTKFEDGTMEWDLRLSMNPTLVQVYHDVVATADESVEVRRAYAALRDRDTRDRRGRSVPDAVRILILTELGLDEYGRVAPSHEPQQEQQQ